MKDQEQDSFLDDIRTARPSFRPSAEEWVKSPRGQRTLSKVLADVKTPLSSSSTPAATGRSPRARMTRCIVITAAATAAICLAVTLPLILSSRGTELPVVVHTSASVAAGASTTVDLAAATPVGGVPITVAVKHVMQLIYTRRMEFAESLGGPPSTDEAALLDEAVSIGLMTSSEASGQSAASISQGRYAVLLWEGFGPYLSLTTAPTSPVVGAADPAQKEAIHGLQSAGILLDTDGPFLADRPLDGEQEQLLLERIAKALNLRVAE